MAEYEDFDIFDEIDDIEIEGDTKVKQESKPLYEPFFDFLDDEEDDEDKEEKPIKEKPKQEAKPKKKSTGKTIRGYNLKVNEYGVALNHYDNRKNKMVDYDDEIVNFYTNLSKSWKEEYGNNFDMSNEEINKLIFDNDYFYQKYDMGSIDNIAREYQDMRTQSPLHDYNFRQYRRKLNPDMNIPLNYTEPNDKDKRIVCIQKRNPQIEFAKGVTPQWLINVAEFNDNKKEKTQYAMGLDYGQKHFGKLANHYCDYEENWEKFTAEEKKELPDWLKENRIWYLQKSDKFVEEEQGGSLITDKDIKKMKKEELISFADTNNIQIDKSSRKKQIFNTIMEARKNKKKEETIVEKDKQEQEEVIEQDEDDFFDIDELDEIDDLI